MHRGGRGPMIRYLVLALAVLLGCQGIETYQGSSQPLGDCTPTAGVPAGGSGGSAGGGSDSGGAFVEAGTGGAFEEAAGAGGVLEQGGDGDADQAPPEALGFILMGQSNGVGAANDNRPAALPDASIPFWRNDYYYNDGPHAFRSLDVYARNNTFSVEVAAARAIQATGRDVFVIKLVRGATYINRWIPGAPVGTVVYPELAEAWAAAAALYPAGTKLVPIFVWYQGEEEAVYRHADDAKALAYVQQWASFFSTVRSNVEAIVGPVEPYIFRTNSFIAGGNHVAVLQAEQAESALPSRLIWTDDAVLKADGKHNTGATSNMLGARLAAQIIADL